MSTTRDMLSTHPDAATPTYDTGAMAMPTDMTYVNPECSVTDVVTDTMRMEDGTDKDLDGVDTEFLIGQLSMILAHERCGRHLYRSVAQRTHNPMLQAQYQRFGEQTEQHCALLSDFIRSLGGTPTYVSPAARATEKMDTGLVESTFMLDGSVDLMTAEAVMLTAVMVAESVDHANWQYLEHVCDLLPSGSVRDRLREMCDIVEEQEDEHLEWATEMRLRMSMLQTRSSMMAKVGMKAEEMLARVRSMFD